MSTASKPIQAPPARLDAEGRLIPWTEAERSQYVEAVREGLARLRAIPDDPSEDDREFFRAIDSHRPERPLFEEYY